MIITEISTLERLEDHEIRSEYGSETLKYDIAAALVAARKMKNHTQVALANIAGVSQAYIAKLESGEANPTIGRIGAILASIWLKSHITLVPIVPSLEEELTKQEETNHEMTDQTALVPPVTLRVRTSDTIIVGEKISTALQDKILGKDKSRSENQKQESLKQLLSTDNRSGVVLDMTNYMRKNSSQTREGKTYAAFGNFSC
jgi:transcriptional regulator with XRE-family HTH domain